MSSSRGKRTIEFGAESAQSGRIPAAFETIQRCISLSNEPSDAVSRLNRTVREFSYVRIALAIGEIELARERAELCRKYGFAANMNRTRIMAQIAVAMCEVRFGNVEHGLAALERALVEGRPIEPCYTDALVALVQAYDEAGQPESALEHMGQLIDHIKQVRFSAVQRLLALPAHLMFDPGCCRQMLICAQLNTSTQCYGQR